MSSPYYIDTLNKLWITDDIAPNGVNVYYIKKISGYTPNGESVFTFFDDFNDNSINSLKWFTDGTGIIEEKYNYAHIESTGINTYPRYVTLNPINLYNNILEYDVKTLGVAVDSCRVGYTSYYTDGNTLACWYLYIDSNSNINFWTRINGVWTRKWVSTYQVLINTWYKFRFIETVSGLKFQLLKADGTLITQSDFFEYTKYHVKNYIYFGQRSTGDAGYFNNFLIRQYASAEPTVTVMSEGSNYKIIVKNNLSTELHNYQINIPTTNLGTITQSTSLCIDNLYKTPLKQPYYKLYENCDMCISHMATDTTNNHTITVYNSVDSVGRFNDNNNSVYFNGVNTRGVILDKSDLDLFNSDTFTLIMWIKQIGNYSNSWCTLLAKSANTTSTSNRWRLVINKNNVCFVIQDNKTILDCVNLSNPIKINDNNWHMITFVRNDSFLYTYKDNIQMQTISLSSINKFSNTNNVDIGCTFTSITYDKFFNGSYGELGLYNNAFNYQTILKYYNLTNKKYIQSTVDVYTY